MIIINQNLKKTFKSMANYISKCKISNLIKVLILSNFFNNINALNDYIELFKVNIKINQDRTIDVKENISYVFQEDIKRHGIRREFPTKYYDRAGNNYNVSFNVLCILRDNSQESYKVINYRNGKQIFIGNAEKFITPGLHIYTINYKTDNQLGFFKDHDELYFNAIGTGWAVPIKKVIVKIQLPENLMKDLLNNSLSKDKLAFEAATGYFDTQERNYKAYLNNKGKLIFETTKILLPNQGITVAVGWPKNYIKEPTAYEKLKRFLSDNIYLILLLVGLVNLLAYYIRNLIKIKSKKKKGTIIPLFYPPKDLLPSAVRYIDKFGFDSKAFAAEIVNMAVHGLLKIGYKKNLLSQTYTIYKNSKLPQNIIKEHQVLLDILFNKNDEIQLIPNNGSIITRAINNLNGYLETLYGNKYFDYHTDTSTTAILISSLFVISSLWFNITIISIILIFGYLAIISIFYYLLKSYSPEGQKLFEDIQGFKQFLTVTESERFKIIGTPPDRTPELFEKYLPYAIALGVEKEWSKQFAPIFDKLKNYQPNWIAGPLDFHNINNITNFSYGLSNSLNSSILTSSNIPASTRPPGSNTGLGGGSRSGGGGGGGGGGAW
ncbi:DUF2207 domain-containing protein [Candidatus Babela massiliensis]|uniref:Predicted membrane protein (DUF2207) n=1 Tax=Candidatus Babela massiliensis TaxID=673862 RepID=V6DEZ9_9BACT|nr:DUF2207 domain-containing protein [Candidatus Babela massiliensis]CDK30129.1 Predicted membrane protein (DUF2207) [Candidatus Babela massiliensis]